jgi:hypothetical protein
VFKVAQNGNIIHVLSNPADKSGGQSRRDDRLLENPLAVLALTRLAAAKSAGNLPFIIAGFVPPREQPRAERLKWVAGLLEEAMFQCATGIVDDGPAQMNEVVAELIENHFIPCARAHFAECVEDAREIVPEMRSQYQEVRKGHLALYADNLHQIRQENTFPELQKRSDKIVLDCEAMGRSTVQTATTICDLYCGAEAVSDRFNELGKSIASKTGTVFHAAARKGILRVCEKLALAPAENLPNEAPWKQENLLSKSTSTDVKEQSHWSYGKETKGKGKRARANLDWKPQHVLDVVRGAIECADFTAMINTLRLVGDLDKCLASTGETGGIKEKVCITRCKGRFRTPTSGKIIAFSWFCSKPPTLSPPSFFYHCPCFYTLTTPSLCEGGWADIMINFRFEDDKGSHICEIQLVHSHLYNVRKNMGCVTPLLLPKLLRPSPSLHDSCLTLKPLLQCPQELQ